MKVCADVSVTMRDLVDAIFRKHGVTGIAIFIAMLFREMENRGNPESKQDLINAILANKDAKKFFIEINKDAIQLWMWIK